MNQSSEQIKETRHDPIGLFYGTDTGFTEIVVKLLEEEFSYVAPNLLTIHNIADVPITTLQQYDHFTACCANALRCNSLTWAK